MAITIKDQEAVDQMRKAGRIVAKVLQEMEKMVKPGVTTASLDQAAEEIIRSYGATPSFKGYGGYPASICASIDEQVIHAIPARSQVLREGSIISIDVGACKDGYHGDAARTLPVGEIQPEARRLIETAKQAFFHGVEIVKPGRHLYEISKRVQRAVESHGYGVVREYVGHGIGKVLHEPPMIPNYKPIGRGPKLKAGMTLAIEPMINEGRPEVEVLEDGWTVVTRDGSRSAHYENTILITETGYEILTVL